MPSVKPTVVRVNGSNRTAHAMCWYLMSLAYNVSTDMSVGFFSQDQLISGDGDFVLDVDDKRIEVCGEVVLLRGHGISDGEFVRFAVYCWGRWRGGRLQFKSPILVDEQRARTLI